MKQFLLVFRADYSVMPKRSPEEAQANTQKWMSWIAGIAAQNKLQDRGNRLATSGRVLGPHGSLTDGPYAEIKESIMGYSIIRASSYEEAAELAGGCPVFSSGGNVEIREISLL